MSKVGLPDVVKTKEYLETLDLVCETHLNFSGKVVDDTSPNSHFHCVDKWFLEQYRRSVTAVSKGDQENKILTEAYKKTGDKEFVKMLVAENGRVDPSRQSDAIAKSGSRELSWGICQIHCPSHEDLCGGRTYPTNPDFWNWEWQVNECYKLWKGGTTFYAYNRLGRDKEYAEAVNGMLRFTN